MLAWLGFGSVTATGSACQSWCRVVCNLPAQIIIATGSLSLPVAVPVVVMAAPARAITSLKVLVLVVIVVVVVVVVLVVIVVLVGQILLLGLP